MLHTRTPPHVAPIARASTTASIPGLPNAGWPGKDSADVGEPDARGHRDPVVLMQAVARDLVARGGEPVRRELVRPALDLLHRQNVDVGSLEEVDDPVDSSPNRVDVPGGEAHCSTVPAAP